LAGGLSRDETPGPMHLGALPPLPDSDRVPGDRHAARPPQIHYQPKPLASFSFQKPDSSGSTKTMITARALMDTGRGQGDRTGRQDRET
jgi:hypothetical protein